MVPPRVGAAVFGLVRGEFRFDEIDQDGLEGVVEIGRVICAIPHKAPEARHEAVEDHGLGLRGCERISFSSTEMRASGEAPWQVLMFPTFGGRATQG